MGPREGSCCDCSPNPAPVVEWVRVRYQCSLHGWSPSALHHLCQRVTALLRQIAHFRQRSRLDSIFKQRLSPGQYTMRPPLGHVGVPLVQDRHQLQQQLPQFSSRQVVQVHSLSGANIGDSAIVNKNRSTSGSGLSPHFPSREIALVVESDLKPHE